MGGAGWVGRRRAGGAVVGVPRREEGRLHIPWQRGSAHFECLTMRAVSRPHWARFVSDGGGVGARWLEAGRQNGGLVAVSSNYLPLLDILG